MPRTSPATAGKRQRLTLGQLAAYDDILTDALVDHVSTAVNAGVESAPRENCSIDPEAQTFYWTTIPKNRTSYHPSRGIKEDEITKIVQTHLIVTPNLALAEEKLLATAGLKKFCNSLKTPKEKADFMAHLRRYMLIHLPDCPFEVNSTNRYTITTQEASITARRYIRRNETIKYLAGIQVVITPEEEAEMASRKKDFSLVVSSRSKSTSLFMGPARFANHDCDANARLITSGQAGIEIIACRDIQVDDEITVSYSDSYFGEDNCECLCQTCETNKVNGWSAHQDGVPTIQKSIEVDSATAAQGYALRRRRRDESVTGGAGSRTPSVTPDLRPRISKRRRSQVHHGDRVSTADLVVPEPSGLSGLVQKRKRDLSAFTPPVTPAKRLRMTAYDVSPIPIASISSRETSESGLASSSVTSEAGNGSVTEATSPEAESPEPAVLSPDPTPTKPPVETLLKREESASDAEVGQILEKSSSVPELESTFQRMPVTEFAIPAAANTNTYVQTRFELAVMDQADPPTEEQTPSKQPRDARDAGSLTPPSTTKPKTKRKSTSNEPASQPIRKYREPGDYTLTASLISRPETAWILCTNCKTAFVQEDSYYTKANCPRCERHSKLYGYVWPKTEPTGPGDREERVLDHRTVHRFLDAEDEARIRGRKFKKVRLGGEKESTQDAEETQERGRARNRDSTENNDDGVSGPRRSGRARRLTAKIVGE